MKITVEMIGLEKTRQELGKLKESPRSPALWSTIAAILKSETLRHFEAESDPTGKKWAPLSASTIEARRKGKSKRKTNRRGYGAKILRDTGRLYGSIATNYGNGWAEVGTTIEYAAQHQFGTKRVPRRSFIGISKRISDRIDATVKKFLETGV